MSFPSSSTQPFQSSNLAPTHHSDPQSSSKPFSTSHSALPTLPIGQPSGPSSLGNVSASPVQAKKRKLPTAVRAKERTASVDIEASTEDDEVSASGRTNRDNKRSRVHFSCVECHRRKQKCDRKEPCSQCVARRVPHLCRPFLNGVEDPANTEVNIRLQTIESLLSRLVSTMPTGNHSSLLGHPDGSSPDVSSLLSPSGEEIFHPRSAQPPEPSRQTVPHKPPPSGIFPANLASTTPVGRTGYGWGLREGRMINLVVEENPDLKDVLNTLKESGISKGHLEWLIAGVPGRRLADGLVELYFRDIDWTRYKMNRPSFTRRYVAFFDAIGRNPTNPKIDGDSLRWLPLLFIVLAIATLSAPSDLVPSDEQLSWSRRFYGSARSGLEYAKALQRDNLDVLFAGLLASRYMLLTRRPAEGSTPLTTAFQLGLYRDGTVLNIADKREIEIRRRAWAMLYHLDRTSSLLVGRPASISDAHTDTRMPANLDDEEIENGDFDPAGHPMTKPTTYTYVILRHKLAEIMGRIAYHTFAIQLPDYATVLNLDRELLAWRDSLPPFFSMTKTDTSLDTEYPYLIVQRHLLSSEWYYTRITLNRPYLLRRKPQDGRYAYSRNAAIESATADLLGRRAFVMEKGDLIVNSGGYRVLNSYMVLGVTIKLDPTSPQADELRHLLNVVSGRARDEQGRLSEPIVKEELAIVEFLTAKANPSKNGQQTSGTVSSTNASGGQAQTDEDHTPVDLLLGLAKTSSGRRAAEEEKRQLRLQQFREREEQRLAARGGRLGNGTGNGPSSPSPWGYVAPQMPGLNVHQPFGNQQVTSLASRSNNSGVDSYGRRLPKPLQPPAPKRSGMENSISSNNWATSTGEIDFSSIGGLDMRPPNFESRNDNTPMSSTSLSLSDSLSPRTQTHPQGHNRIEDRTGGIFNTGQSSNQLQGPMDYVNLLPMPQARDRSIDFSAETDIFGQNQSQQQSQPQQQQHQQIGDSQGLGTSDQQAQFGTAPMEGFDFANLGVAPMDPMQFNPFALAQTAEESGNETGGEDDETAFLNFILTKFANSQPEVQ